MDNKVIKLRLYDIYEKLQTIDVEKSLEEIESLKTSISELIKEIEKLDDENFNKEINKEPKHNMILERETKSKYEVLKKTPPKKEFNRTLAEKFAFASPFIITILLVIILLILIYGGN